MVFNGLVVVVWAGGLSLARRLNPVSFDLWARASAANSSILSGSSSSPTPRSSSSGVCCSWGRGPGLRGAGDDAKDSAARNARYGLAILSVLVPASFIALSIVLLLMRIKVIRCPLAQPHGRVVDEAGFGPGTALDLRRAQANGPMSWLPLLIGPLSIVFKVFADLAFYLDPRKSGPGSRRFDERVKDRLRRLLDYLGGAHLRLMTSANDVRTIPTEGKNLSSWPPCRIYSTSGSSTSMAGRLLTPTRPNCLMRHHELQN